MARSYSIICTGPTVYMINYHRYAFYFSDSSKMGFILLNNLTDCFLKFHFALTQSLFLVGV